MKSLHSLSDHVSGLTAQAIQAFAHGTGLDPSRLREWNAPSVPTEGFIGDPAALPAGRSYPDAGLPPLMHDGQSPLRLKVENVLVWDDCATPGIDDLERILFEDEFRSDPDRMSEASQEEREGQFSDVLNPVIDDEKTVGYEENDQEKRDASPSEIALRAKCLVHMPSIAGGGK